MMTVIPVHQVTLDSVARDAAEHISLGDHNDESQTRNPDMKLYCIIAPQDVTQYRYRTPTQRRNILNCLGRVLKCDVGKRVYEVVCDDGVSVIYQVENQQQLATRLGSVS